MKTKLLVISIPVTLFIIAMIFCSCTKHPSPGFIYYIYTSKEYSGKVDFKNTSTDADSYLWEFGDSAKSTEINPTHTYTENKEYKVKLTAKDSKNSGENIQTITISSFISKATISILKASIPDKNPSNSNWDATGTGATDYRPDVYFVIKKGTTMLYTQATPNTNVSVSSVDTVGNIAPYSYMDANGHIINTYRKAYGLVIDKADFSSALTLQIWDEDGTTDELIGSIPLTLSSYITGTTAYPVEIPLTANGIQWTIELSWH